MTREQRSRCMSRIRGCNTRPERLVRSALWRIGFRYRLKSRLPGRPDIVFPRERIAVFIDGCFWHRCPDHYSSPVTNARAWDEKISANVRRDRAVDEQLAADGWEVLRFWEHQVKVDPARVAGRVAGRITAARRRLAKRPAAGSRQTLSAAASRSGSRSGKTDRRSARTV